MVKKKTQGRKKRVPKYPAGVVVPACDCDIEKLKACYEGKLPQIKSTKYPKTEDGWRKFYAAALTYKNKERYCRLNGYDPPVCIKKYQYEYVLYHGRPDKKRDRAARNRDRKIHGLKKGDPLVVHHLDPGSMATKKTVKLTHCQHQKMHGKVCKDER